MVCACVFCFVLCACDVCCFVWGGLCCLRFFIVWFVLLVIKVCVGLTCLLACITMYGVSRLCGLMCVLGCLSSDFVYVTFCLSCLRCLLCCLGCMLACVWLLPLVLLFWGWFVLPLFLC